MTLSLWLFKSAWYHKVSSEKTEFLAEVIGNFKSESAKKTRFLTFLRSSHRNVCAILFLEEIMNFSLFTSRRIWFVVGFALLLMLAVSYALTETTLGATLAVNLYLPLISNVPQLCGAIPS